MEGRCQYSQMFSNDFSSLSRVSSTSIVLGFRGLVGHLLRLNVSRSSVARFFRRLDPRIVITSSVNCKLIPVSPFSEGCQSSANERYYRVTAETSGMMHVVYNVPAMVGSTNVSVLFVQRNFAGKGSSKECIKAASSSLASGNGSTLDVITGSLSSFQPSVM